MREHKITFRLDSAIELKEEFCINNVKLYNGNRNLYAKINIFATDSESAKDLARKKMANVCSTIRFFQAKLFIIILKV